MKNLLFLFFLFFCFFSYAQQKFTISGKIHDAKNGEELIGASVRTTTGDYATTTNEYGFYSLTIPEGSYTLTVSYIGYDEQKIEIKVTENSTQNFSLKDESTQIDGVVIKTKKSNDNIKNTEMGVERIDPKSIERIPVIFGEKDIVKTLQLLPGVKSAGEGGAGFFVRGGAADQNLILLDEAIVYNASHLMGFFSTFNSDAIKDVTLYKGNQPANYGGRLASVMDIKMKEGNNKRFNVDGGIGLIASRLSVQGPIVKDKGSFLISGRRTYADLFLKMTKQFNKTKLYFYDLNLKANYNIGKKDRIFLSGYFGRDVLGMDKIIGIDWGNATGTLRWNHIINDKLFSNTSIIYSDYDYSFKISTEDITFKILSRINDVNLKQDFQWFINNNHKFRFGVQGIYHEVLPGQLSSNSDLIKIKKLPKMPSLELAAYAMNDHQITKKLSATYGIRFTTLSVLGNGNPFYSYDSQGELSSSKTYNRGQFAKTYFNVEPRLALSFAYNETSSFKLAYARNVQNVHTLSNSTSSSPTDVVLFSSLNIKPEVADQVSIGWFKNFKEGMYEVNIESYYKYMQNQIDYRNGANIQSNEFLEGQLLYGIGRAYGVEFIIRKKEGKFTGWISYTLSKTERKIDQINDGNWYNAKQDRTHDLSVVAMYEINKKLALSGVFVFYTGNAVTFPTGKYNVDGETHFSYTSRNADRMPAYHRLDLGLTWYTKNTEKFESSWNFSIYNVYGRSNAYTISFRQNADNPNVTEAVRTALFRFVPSITYNFKFK
jgi:hypothetical protein